MKIRDILFCVLGYFIVNFGTIAIIIFERRYNWPSFILIGSFSLLFILYCSWLINLIKKVVEKSEHN